MTIRCIHCGTVTIDDPALVAHIRGQLTAQWPMAGVMCPRCREEVKFSWVSDAPEAAVSQEGR